MALSSKQARYLKGLAHHLHPVAMVGDRGVTPALLEKVDTELENHELIKVRVAADRDAVREAGQAVAEESGADLVQIIGKIVVLYRARAKKPAIQLPE